MSETFTQEAAGAPQEASQAASITGARRVLITGGVTQAQEILRRMQERREQLAPLEAEIVESDPADRDPAEGYSDERLIEWQRAQRNNICAVCRTFIRSHTIPTLRACMRKMARALKRKAEAEGQSCPEQASGAPTRSVKLTGKARRLQNMQKAEAQAQTREINSLGTRLSDLISTNGSRWSAEERSSYEVASRELGRVASGADNADPEKASAAYEQAKEILTAGIAREEVAAQGDEPAVLDSSLPRVGEETTSE